MKSMKLNSNNSRYVSFRDDLEDEIPPRSNEPVSTVVSDIELNGAAYASSSDRQGSPDSSGMTPLGSGSLHSKRVRLRAVDSESDYFLKLMHIDLFRKLLIVQASSALVILIGQILMYTISSWEVYQILDYVGIGLWGPMLFFAPTCWLTFTNIRTPSGCSIGAAMACHILSIIVSLLILLFSTIVLTQRGRYTSWRQEEHDPEIGARIVNSFMVLGSICITVSSLIASIQYCKVTCCGRSNANEMVLFDVEPVTV